MTSLRFLLLLLLLFATLQCHAISSGPDQINPPNTHFSRPHRPSNPHTHRSRESGNPSFCTRSISRNSCPDPRTADYLKIKSYMGTWYQIASTGRYKLTFESGLVCEQANYTLVNSDEYGTSKISVINSGASVISRLEAMGIARMDFLAHTVSQIQQIHARLSRDDGLRWSNLNQLSEVVATAINAVRSFNGEIVYATNTKRVILSEAAVLASENPSLAFQLGAAAYDIHSELVKIQSNLAYIRFVLTNMEVTSITFGAQPSSSTWPPVMFGQGSQNSSSPGKIGMNFSGVESPYWIIRLEGSAREGYRAALVYRFREDLQGEIHEDLFVLSRTRDLEKRVMNRFIETAARYGIYTDCDNPFIMTHQRGGSCGAP
eukprot:Gb_35276 [translate_table: standard]